ncbi:hypothetical protein ACFGZH_10905, partial [Pasteurella multocida]|uniref:hypothetical protein n=1 Tax=Pasteurella multocida TaxID=747 RepID=UPI00202267FA
ITLMLCLNAKHLHAFFHARFFYSDFLSKISSVFQLVSNFLKNNKDKSKWLRHFSLIIAKYS